MISGGMGRITGSGTSPRSPLCASKYYYYYYYYNYYYYYYFYFRKPGCTGRARYRCSKCNVGLHPGCFEDYHTAA